MNKGIDPAIPKPPKDERSVSTDENQEGIDPAIPKPPKSEESSEQNNR